MIIKSAEFVTSAVRPSQYPPAVLPEVAFAGRSNVGKSSLINTLVNRKHLVKTSATPGRTQLINFFNINDKLSFVDIPGYGYAKVPVSVKKKWGPMIETYLTTRKTLKGIVLILDIRRIPGQQEMNMLDWLNHYTIPFVLVLTKSDKLSKIRQKKQLTQIANTLSTDRDHFVLFSAKSRQGKDEVWEAVNQLIL
ncbi:MAG: ribosome biogenesis GTP-binding protein YihA/YsxC [Thermodesulfobacteriota bacterium]|nr:ribosome biogenesis GTP-binding protein YihA/YsxC [Thermodesulfobacteriota bacterium]